MGLRLSSRLLARGCPGQYSISVHFLVGPFTWFRQLALHAAGRAGCTWGARSRTTVNCRSTRHVCRLAVTCFVSSCRGVHFVCGIVCGIATLCILPLVVAAHVVRVVVVVIALIFGSFRGPSICYLSSRSCLACPYSLPFGLPGAVLWDSRRSFWHPLWQPLWTLLQVSIGCLSGSCPGAPGQALLAHLWGHWVTHRVLLGFLFGILFGSLYVHAVLALRMYLKSA